MAKFFILLFIVLCCSLHQGCRAATFTISNNCQYTVWPGILSNAGTAALPTTGFQLQQGESKAVNVPTGWSGRLWGRTLCSTDSSGKFSCSTGDCGSGALACSGDGAAPPATLAEFTLDGSGGMDFYDVSLVDGYNLPVLVVPSGGTAGNCSSTGCLVDLNGICPSDLKVVMDVGDGGSESVACKSACEAFGSPEYCCSGEYGNPNTCKPSAYSQFFKNACPRAYSYAYDDATSTFTCANADYAITFCPSTTSEKSSGGGSGGDPEAAYVPSNDTMVFLGGSDISGSTALPAAPTTLLAILLSAVTLILTHKSQFHHV